MALGITAIISAYNEEDVIGQVIADFVRQDIRVHFIDNHSTDGTLEEVRAFVGRGVSIEQFPVETGDGPSRFQWENILRRKEQLALSLDGDWFLHTDADELRESPWPEQSLREGIELCDRLGYNALDFAVLNFFPTRDGFQKGEDLRQFFTHFEPGGVFDRAQIKAWKRQPDRVDLASSGGHDVAFVGRRVCPVRFLLRHYPIRSQEHGERKIFVERRPRFIEAEQRRGWHVQYAAFTDGQQFVRDAATLTRFDPEAVRRQAIVRHRSEDLLEHAQDTARAYEKEEARLSVENQQLARTVAERHQRAEMLEHEARGLREDVAARERLLALLQADTEARRRELEQLCREHAARTAELAELQSAQRLLANESEMLRAVAQREREALLREAAEDRQALLREAGDQLDGERRAAEALIAAERAQHAAELAEERRLAGDELARAAELSGEHETRAAQLESAYDSRVAQLERTHEARVAQLERARDQAAAEAAQLRAALDDAQARVDQILGSRTWRWSAGAREAWRIIGRK